MVVKIENKHSRITNNLGFLTVDFLFAIVIACGLCAILFAICFSFINVEVAQYIAYATARAHSSAHLTVADQTKAARTKYSELLNNEYLGNVFKNGWISISAANQVEIRSGVANGGTFNQDYASSGQDGSGSIGIPFIGVRISLKFNMLDFNVPFLGRTSDGDDEAFSAKVTSFLIREPSYQECHEFFGNQRMDAILELDQARFSKAAATKDMYFNMEDNGC